MIRSTGTLTSPKASQYLQQLCKHFAHKVEVSFDAHQGHVTLGGGPVALAATEHRLAITVTAPDLAALPQAR